MKRVLVAGASGALGSCVVKELRARGAWVRAITRSKERARHIVADEVVIGDALRPDSLPAPVRDIDVVFSCLGQTVSPDFSIRRPGYLKVDLPANFNLLTAARTGGVSRFVYVSVLNAARFPGVAYLAAHAQVSALIKESRIDYGIVEPTGFFSQLGSLLDLARAGRAMLFGAGETRSNPIAEADLAEVCADLVDGVGSMVVQTGGPDILTRRQMYEEAFAALNQPPNIRRLPLQSLGALRWLTGWHAPRISELLHFVELLSQHDFVAPIRGRRRLREHFAALAQGGVGC